MALRKEEDKGGEMKGEWADITKKVRFLSPSPCITRKGIVWPIMYKYNIIAKIYASGMLELVKPQHVKYEFKIEYNDEGEVRFLMKKT